LYRGWGGRVGIPKAPNWGGARDCARRFNATYREIFPEPATMLAETSKILGTDGRKMSKSYNNAVYLTEPAADVEKKLSRMVTDPRRARRTDPGVPEDCPAYVSFHRTYCTPEELRWQEEGCRTAGIGCLECKKVMIKHVVAELEPIRERRARLTADDARAALAAGNARAQAIAARTMAEVREALGLR
jgi:tryptophanyl-tRNA synthetase